MGRPGETRNHTGEGPHCRIVALNLLAAIIYCWNTDQLNRAVRKHRHAGLEVPDHHLQHASPLGWNGTLLAGEYRCKETLHSTDHTCRILPFLSHMTSNHRNLIAACAAIAVFGLSFGMTFPLLSLLLESRGTSSTMIGLNTSMGTLGIIAFSPFIPALSKRFGSRQVAITAAVLTTLCLPALKIFSSLESWFILRFIQGASTAVLWSLSEAWIVRYSSDNARGRVVAIYSSILSASFGVGPLIIGVVGVTGWVPFLIGTAALLIGMIPLCLIRDEAITKPDESVPSGLLEFAPKAPLLLFCVLVFAIFDAATLALLPVYGIYNGLALSESAYLLSTMIVGNIVMQFPIGWLADRIPKRMVMMGCAIMAALFMSLLPFVIGTPWRWGTVILIGAFGYGVYTVALADLGDRFSGTQLVNGAASFAAVWGMGAFLGSVSGGWAMAFSSLWGLPGYLAVCYLLLGAGLYFRQHRSQNIQPPSFS